MDQPSQFGMERPVVGQEGRAYWIPWQLVVALALLMALVIAQCCWICRLLWSLGWSAQQVEQEPEEQENVIYLSPTGKKAHVATSCGSLSHLKPDQLRKYPYCMLCAAQERKPSDKGD